MAAGTFRLDIPPLKMLTSKEDLSMARAAYARQPENSTLRFRLATSLTLLDHFDEALALLEAHPSEDLRDLFLLSTVLLNRENKEDDLRALAVCERALERSTTPKGRAHVRTQLAKAHHRLGHFETSKALLLQALEEYPGEKDAYKRLFRHLLEHEADPDAALAFAEKAIASGVVHARVLGSWVLALAKLGRLEEARRANGADEFLVQLDPPPPRGWGSTEEFHAALAAEALEHPDMRYERYGSASAQTWRLDEPALQRTKVFPQLQELIKREVEAFAATLTGNEHPFAKALPAHATLRNWCVITEGQGYETYHVHQNGWLSGVYYIHVQDHIANGTAQNGCIALGLPDFLVGEDVAAEFGERLIRPRSGLMMMFPSHVYHRTYPHQGTGRRICYAFDIIPSGDTVADGLGKSEELASA